MEKLPSPTLYEKDGVEMYAGTPYEKNLLEAQGFTPADKKQEDASTKTTDTPEN